MTSDQAFLLLDWIRSARTRNTDLPEEFFRSVSNGKWLKISSGVSSPSQSILPDTIGKVCLDMMENFMADFAIVQIDFYTNKIALYADVLKYLGVAFGLDDMLKLILERSKCCASSGMSKECAFTLLTCFGLLEDSKCAR